MFYVVEFVKVCLLQTDPQWKRNTISDGSESEYMYKDRDWISYDTIENIQKRAAYVVANNLGGLFVWSRMYFFLNKKLIELFYSS